MTNKTSGFTLVEVIVAIVILSIGLMALAGATANVSRMAGYGKWNTAASQVAIMRLEAIRQVAYSTTPACTSTALVGGGPVSYNGMVESWSIVGTGSTRVVLIVVSYPRATTIVTDSVTTILRCS
ncbi:MAG: type II secretion system protein [Gemmatimonadales bacterium]